MKDKILYHLHSFAKTYITVALGSYLALTGFAEQMDLQDVAGLDLTEMTFVVISLKSGLVAVLRNIYKLLTEK